MSNDPVLTSAHLSAAPIAEMRSRRDANVRHKVSSINVLGDLAEEIRRDSDGKDPVKIVLCHGVFDVLHLGHVRHLEAARRLGTHLFVTVTANALVNKGPGRPYFDEKNRAEMLASLEYVDFVGINYAPDALPVIHAIKPDVYAKGQDYHEEHADVSGKIGAERQAVEEHGGGIVFTDEVTDSSSKIINQCLQVFDKPVENYLDSLRQDGALDRMTGLLDSIANYNVLIVGDAIIDEYQYVVPMGKSAKEHMIATLYQNKEVFAGGVFATANHLAKFCRNVDVVTALGADDPYEEQIRQELQPNVNLKALYREGVPTTRKSRSVDPTYMRKLFEVYYMDDRPLSEEVETEFRSLLQQQLGDYDAVIVNDFGHGLLQPRIISTILSGARFTGVNAQSNSANTGYNPITRYRGAEYICIDALEARLAVHEKFLDLDRLIPELLHPATKSDKIIVTHGRHGCFTFETGGAVKRLPALADSVADTMGAGDALLAVTTPLVAAGGNLEDIGFIGNIAGAIKVGIVGHRSSVDKVSVVKALTALLK